MKLDGSNASHTPEFEIPPGESGTEIPVKKRIWRRPYFRGGLAGLRIPIRVRLSLAITFLIALTILVLAY